MASSNHGNAPPAWADPSNHAPIVESMSIQQHEQALFSEYSTLDEPVRETVMRDVRAVAAKLKIVLSPFDIKRTLTGYAAGYAGVSMSSTHPEQPQQAPGDNGAQQPDQQHSEALSETDRKVLKELKDWDLWGPLLVCLALAVILSFKAPTNQASLVFAAVFMSVWVGGTVITINAQLLGGNISFFQSLCVLGYCCFPMTLAALVIGVLKIVVKTWWWLDLLIIAFGFLWATRVSSIFIGLYVQPTRRFLALYPVFFFYTFLGWMILLF